MGDDAVRLAHLGLLLRRRWRFFVVVAVLGALAGAGLWVLIPLGYRTSTNVLLQGQHSSDELITQSQVAKSSVVLDRTAAALAWHPARATVDGKVSAEVGDGNVIVITGTADTPEHAQQLTDELARQYVSFATQLAMDTGKLPAQELSEQRQALTQEITKINERITDLQSTAGQNTAADAVRLRSELELLRTSLNQAMAKLDESSTPAGAGNIVVISPAELPTSRTPPTLVQLAGGGALVAMLLGVFGNLAAARRDRRLRNEEEIGAALGAPVLATIDVPDDQDQPAAGRAADGSSWTSRLRSLVLGRRPWYLTQPPVAGDELSRQIRCRRALARLRGDMMGPLRVLVLVPDDDNVAHRAAAQLAATAAGQQQPMGLHPTDVAVRRPTIPDSADVTGALVVVTTGTRTGWELLGLVEACADAGHRVLGAVVAHPATPVDGGRDERAEVRSDTMVGSPGPPP